MKVSSISTGSIEQTFETVNASVPFLAAVQHALKSIQKTVNHIGTSIALGESGNLDAAHAFREKNAATK